jgi:putative nucleotidyltransferase with HDIG domain
MINILFVDDESHVLAGLRRSLFDVSDDWQMHFSVCGNDALDFMRNNAVDVIVSDIRMPEMDGITLLKLVRTEFPDVVRILLSGYAEYESTIRSIPVAHQFLNKPCEPITLQLAIHRATELQEHLTNIAMRRTVGAIESLPSPSEQLRALNSCLESKDPPVEEVIRIVERDIAMTAKLLQLATSAFFGLGREICDVRDAVMYLGLNTVRDLTTAADAFRGLVDGETAASAILDIERHSLEVGEQAMELMSTHADARRAFSSGLLHDIGSLVLATHRPDDFLAVVDAQLPSIQRLDLERQLFGVTHAEIGAYLLMLWGLPFDMIEAVARHHEPITDGSEMSIMQAIKLAELRTHAKLTAQP